MTGIGTDLRNELEHILNMLPIWQRHEVATLRDFSATKSTEDFVAYTESVFKVRWALEQVQFINRLLVNNPDE